MGTDMPASTNPIGSLTCGFRNTMSGAPCANPVAPGTVRCAAGHRVDRRAATRADDLALPGDLVSSPTLDADLFGLSTLDDAGQLYNDIKSQYPDVQLGIGVLDGGEVVLDFLRLLRTERGKGTGSRILEAVCARADLNEWTVLCRPTQAFGGDLTRLEEFFGRYGFRPMTESERRGKDWNTWARWPEAPFA